MIPDYRHKQDTISVSADVYRLLFEYSKDANGYFDLDGKLLLINNKGGEFLGGHPDQFIGKYPEEFLSKEIAKIHRQQLKLVIDSGKELTYETKTDISMGKRLLKTVYKPVFGDDKKLMGIFLSSSDITDLKKAEITFFESEVLFKTIFELAAVGISQVNPSGEIIRVNQKFADILGYTRKELLGKNFREYTYPSDLRIDEEKVNLINTGKTDSLFLEKRYVHKTGRIIWVNVYSAVLRGVDGKWNYSVTVINDITEQKQAQNELIWQKTLLETTFDSISDGIIITNPDRIIMLCNKGVKTTFGYSPDELIGKSIEVVYAKKEDFVKMGEQHFTVDRPEEDRIFHAEFIRKDSSVFLGETNGMRLYSKNGEYLGNFGITRNITERANLMNELLKAKEKAEESDRLKSAFLANMSHEIRTPMNGIIGFSELLKGSDITEEEKDSYISIIHDSSRQLLNIVNDIIDISKIEAGQIEIYESKLVLNELLQEIFIFYKTNAANKNITLKIRKGLSDSKSNILTDNTKLHQILNNLISNAVKFTSKGFVEFGYQLEEDMLAFYVKDTGIGIPEDHHKTIFERFRQVDNSMNRVYGGTGLGLSISYAYIKKMGGKMQVKSSPGEGSVFYFTIPYKPVNKISTIKSDHSLQSNARLKILIVEDNEINFSFLKAALKKPNIHIIHACSGEEALEICRNDSELHLVLMDIKLPGMDGYTATSEIKKIRPGLKVIAQTAYAMSGDENLALDAGCDDYLTKPIKLDDLKKTLKKFLD